VTRIGLITGMMGAPMALHLVRAGHDVTVFDRSADAAGAATP
jgi:3-hydroxyisobutyrate dehydrogenase-like beta-hydroxyacid dehydrogenase